MVFETIYQAYWNRIFRLCRGYLGDDDWAKDAAQDTFVSVYNNLSGFRNESAISTWIYRIAVNHCLRQLEKGKRMPKADVTDRASEHDDSTSDEQIALLYRYIGELKEIDRIIISLELDDVRQAEIATITGLSESNVRVRIHRIKDQLSQKFKKHERD